METRAHTLVYDSIVMGDTMSGNPLSISKWASVTTPTLVMHGGKSPDWMQHGAQALVDILPNAQHHHFPDQDHYIALEVLFPVLIGFFQGSR
jgi:pimeloyl-ACP methyl ester carboxylesterase